MHGCRVQGFGFKALGIGRVSGAGFRDWGCGLNFDWCGLIFEGQHFSP